MKRLLFIIILFNSFTIYIFSQITGKTLTINGAPQGGTWIARDWVYMGPSDYPYGAVFEATIDENQIYNVETESTQPDMNRSINTALPVGSIPGSFNVTPTGAATYIIPIDIPPGKAGMQPQVAVGYNSMGGNGSLGIRWNFSAASAITPANSTIYHDGMALGIDYDANDQFALDGMRLVITRPFGAAGPNVQLATETESYSVIMGYDSNSDGQIDYFMVYTKDGKTVEYGNTEGNTSNSKYYIGAYLAGWMINKVSDVHGNYMTYEYGTNALGEIYLKKINYTGTGTFAPLNSVNFYYENRVVGKTTTYEKGHLLTQSLLLRKIKTYCQGNQVKEYSFTYHNTSADIYTYLTKIDLCMNGEHLNQTIVNWNKNNNTWSNNNEMTGLYLPLDGIHNRDKHLYTGDFNGDGVMDILKMYDKEVSGVTKAFALKYLGSKPIFQNSLPSFIVSGVPIDLGYNTMYEDFGMQKGGLMIFDSDNSGKDDICYVCLQDVAGQKSISINFPNAGSSFTLNYTDFVPLYTTCNLNGDGKADFLSMKRNSQIQYGIGYYPSLTPGSSPTNMIINKPLISGNEWQIKKILTLDLNNDGLDDLITMDEQGYYIFYNKGQNNSAQPYFNPDPDLTGTEITYKFYAATGSAHSKVYPGDYNGDGLVDLLCYVITGQYTFKWVLAINRDNGFSFTDVSSNINSSIYDDNDTDKDDERDYGYVADYNKDGKTDIILYDACYSGIPKVFNDIKKYIYLSNGTSFTQYGSTDTINDEESGMAYLKTLGDFNGDGSSDFVYYSEDNDKYYCNYSYNTLGAHCANKIMDGFNNYVRIEYNKTTDGGIYSYDIADFSYPLLHLKIPLNVVQYVYSPNGIGSETSGYYKYKNAVVHGEGKGFLGFTKFESTNYSTGIKQTNSFINSITANSTTFYLTLPKETIIDNSGQGISKAVNIYAASKATSSKIIFPYVNQSISTDSLNNFKTFTYNYYNAEGNLDSSEVKFYENDTIAVEKTIYEGYADRITTGSNVNTVPNMPTYIKKYRRHKRDDNGKVYARVTKFEYNTNGSLSRLITDPALAKRCTTNYAYFTTATRSYGLLSSQSVTDGTTSRPVSYTYDDYGIFVKRITDALGNYTENFYDHQTGNLMNSRDINGNYTYYTYDGFGALVATKYPTGIVSNMTRTWNIVAGSQSLYTIFSTLDGGTSLSTTYDRLGRPIQEGSWNPYEIEYALTDKIYNFKGQLLQVSDPYFNGETKKWSAYTYDDFERISTESYNGEEIKNYNYNGFNGKKTKVSNTKTSNAEYSEKTIDATGQIIKSQDPYGYVTYQYDATWSPKTITSPGSSISITYDPYGRQESLNDPDAGPNTYEYNAYGELVKQIDNRGSDYGTDITYDTLGRLESETDNEGTTTYEYYTSGDGLGLLKKVTAPNGMYDSYTYDKYGNMLTETAYIESGVSYTNTYQYDANGRVVKITYPSGFAVRRSYVDGSLYEVRRDDNNTLVWNAGSMKANGQWENYTLGNNLYTTIKTYDAYNNLATIQTIKNSNSTNIQSLGYSYDPATGNISWRKDYMHTMGSNPLTEDFQYDLVNRLTQWRVNYGSWNAITYDNAKDGNITSKALVGTYSYGSPAGPHALTELSNYAADVPSGSQTVTYNAFNKVSTITEGSNSATITYGPGKNRRKGVYNTGTKFYFNGYETKDYYYTYCYIEGGDGLAAIYYDNGDYGSMYYVLKDHLGSFNMLVNDYEYVMEENSFDAWGRRRNPTNWTYTGVPTSFITDRGFTGHEHLDGFSLINMNGRVYDPYLGRFLSPDNYVQAPDFTQSFNRYSYCLNNPLIYTDPSGEFLTWNISNNGFSIGWNWTPIGIPLGAGINVGWADGFSLGGYGEVGYRVGGTGLGSGITQSQSLDYNFKYNTWSTTTSAGAYASFGPFNAGANFSVTQDITNNQVYTNWGVTAGIGTGNGQSGIGLYGGYGGDFYGSGSCTYGIGGSHYTSYEMAYMRAEARNYNNVEAVFASYEAPNGGDGSFARGLGIVRIDDQLKAVATYNTLDNRGLLAIRGMLFNLPDMSLKGFCSGNCYDYDPAHWNKKGFPIPNTVLYGFGNDLMKNILGSYSPIFWDAYRMGSGQVYYSGKSTAIERINGVNTAFKSMNFRLEMGLPINQSVVRFSVDIEYLTPK